MNREESIALYERAQAAEKKKKDGGRKVWNAWAEELLRQKADLEKEGHWDGASEDWHDAASVDFSDRIFQDANFFYCIFPSRASFAGATFSGYAGFGHVVFNGYTLFRGATLQGHARFGRARFIDYADFRMASFQTDVDFYDATFHRADFESAMLEGDAGFHRAVFQAAASFRSTTFQRASFDYSIFQGLAEFNSATFRALGLFTGTTFEGIAEFERAKFEGVASFEGATFRERARFVDATFKGSARFLGAMFQKTARFVGTCFQGGTRFDKAKFSGRCLFRAATVESAFSVSGSDFCTVPDFIQATFAEAPRFDDARIRRPIVAPSSFWRRFALLGLTFKNDEDESARYRALKGLAIKANDHGSELSFFAGEIVCRRGVQDFPLPRPWHPIVAWKTSPGGRGKLVWRWKNEEFEDWPKIWPGGARYWAGQMYETVSDFGRSLVRPLLWWFYVICLYAVAYFSQYFATRKKSGALASLVEAAEWAWTKLLNCIPWMGFPEPSSLKCVNTNPIVEASRMEPWGAALYVSVRRAFVLNTGDDNDKLSIAYACLYGDYSEQMPNSFRVMPHIPDAVSALAITQSLLSAALIFLFLLAVRNHFRIK